jgi:hypothetical protein
MITSGPCPSWYPLSCVGRRRSTTAHRDFASALNLTLIAEWPAEARGRGPPGRLWVRCWVHAPARAAPCARGRILSIALGATAACPGATTTPHGARSSALLLPVTRLELQDLGIRCQIGQRRTHGLSVVAQLPPTPPPAQNLPPGAVAPACRRGGRQLGVRCGSLVMEREDPATHGRHTRSRLLAEPGAASARVAERLTAPVAGFMLGGPQPVTARSAGGEALIRAVTRFSAPTSFPCRRRRVETG